jgi:DNA mismatch endonuclease (patch repair protein)
MDVHEPAVRSYNMSQIKGKNTKPEILVRKFLFSAGMRYRLHVKSLPGKPDIVLKKYKTIIDIRGCFWHAHKDCKFGDQIKSESIEINEKIRTAVMRDKDKVEKWRRKGWNVVVIWDSCELETKKKKSLKRERTLNKLIQRLKRSDTNN